MVEYTKLYKLYISISHFLYFYSLWFVLLLASTEMSVILHWEEWCLI